MQNFYMPWQGEGSAGMAAAVELGTEFELELEEVQTVRDLGGQKPHTTIFKYIEYMGCIRNRSWFFQRSCFIYSRMAAK